MKLFILLTVFGVSICFATNSYSQTTILSINVNNMTVKEVFSEIRKNSEYIFFYRDGVVDLERKVSLHLKNQKIDAILDKLFENTNNDYVISDRQITITHKQEAAPAAVEAVQVSTPVEEEQQGIPITGTVKDADGQPLPGVTVMIKGATQGTATDANGAFSLSVPDANATLVFSYIGYVKQEIPVGNQRIINVSLKEDTQAIEEIVVVGYGTQSRTTITTSVSKVDDKVLENVPYANLGSALQGSVAGVRVQSISGQPGDAPRVIIRGGTSINNPNGATPLYIIDGIQRTDMADLSSDDIESMQVLKDAASTAIYGTRASNGVVVITTKSGKAGKTKINYRYDLTMSETGKKYEMASARDYLTLTRLGYGPDPRFGYNGAVLNSPGAYGIGNDLTNNTIYSTQYLTDANRHKLSEGWQSMPDPADPSKTLIFCDNNIGQKTFRTGFSHNHHVEASGGNEKATFNAGIGYLDNQGPIINTDYQRLSVNLNGTLHATEQLSFSGRMLYSDSKSKKSQIETDAYYYLPATIPTLKFQFEDGTPVRAVNREMGDPEYLLNIDKYNKNTENLTILLNAEWKILPKLTFTPQISMFNVTGIERNFTPGHWEGPTTYVTTRTASSTLDKWKQYQAEGVFNYLDTFGSDHNIGVMAGYSYYYRDKYRFRAVGRGASSDKVPTLNAIAERTSTTSTVTDQVLIGYFGRINYNYRYKYLLTLNARYDGASNLGDNNKWGFFPGVSVGWNMDREKFWTFLPQDLLKVKLRVSYGVNGNISGLGDFDTKGSYSVGSRYMNNPAITMSAMPNEDLKWERSKTTNLGMDMGLFKERIHILFDWYNRVTDELLTNLALPPSTGFGSIRTNLGSLQNRGIELEISADVLPETSDLRWNMSFNVAKVNTKILKLPPNGIEKNRVGGIYIWDAALGDYAWKGGTQEGGRLGDMFAYKQLSIYATDEEARNAPRDDISSATDKTKLGGDVKWLDADGNGIINDRDRAYMGNPYPTLTGGFSNMLSYKGFDLYIRMDYTAGHTINNFVKAYMDYNWGGTNMTQDVVNRSWKKQGDIADMPRYTYGDNTYRGSNWSSLYHERGDFLCIREASLSYQVPAEWLNKIRINGLRLSVTGNNLYYFTKFTGLNPEEGGQDDGRYAMPRNLIMSARITF